MDSTDARRERLFSPVALGVVGALFATAFVAFNPSRSVYNTDSADKDADGNGAPDALKIAYLRARSASDKVSDTDYAAAIVALAQDGRTVEAREMMATRGQRTLTEQQNIRIRLELADKEWRSAGIDDKAERHGAALAVVRELRSREDLQALPLVQRAADLSIALQAPRLVTELHNRLLVLDAPNGLSSMMACGDALVLIGAHGDAATCYAQAAELSTDEAERYDIDLRRFAVSGGDLPARRLATELSERDAASIANLESLATVALSKEMPDIAANVYERLAAKAPSRRGEFLPKASRWAEASGQTSRAAVLLARIEVDEIEGDHDDHLRELERLALASGDYEAALGHASSRVQAAPNDESVVAEAVAVAQAAGEVSRALAWNTQYLEAGGDDPAAIDREVELSLAAGNLVLARRWAEEGLERDPDAEHRHAQLAQIAEWTGDSDTALTEHRWIADNVGTAAAHRKVADLAESSWRPAIAAEALLELARRNDPDAKALSRMIEQFEADGRPKDAAAAIEEINRIHGVQTWRLRELARLRTRHLQLDEALGTWERVADHSGRGGEETLARIELLWRTGRQQETRALAQDFTTLGKTVILDADQASLLSEIGWRYRLADVSEMVRNVGVDVGSSDQRQRHGWRYINDLEKNKQYADASKEAERNWRDTSNTDFLIAALRLSAQSSDVENTRKLLAEASTDGSLVKQGVYWRTVAQAALLEGDGEGAQQAYERALDIDAEDSESVAGLLWLALGASDTDALKALLNDTVPAVQDRPQLWSVIAMSHAAVGDAHGSLVWFEKALQSVGSDYGLVLAWADALEQAGDVDRAREARAFAVSELRPRLVAGVRGHEDELLRQYGRVLGRYGRADDNEAWVNFLMSTDLDLDDQQRIWREDIAISWLMSTERHEHARMIMARTHGARLSSPIWQDIALALHADDRESIAAMLDSGAGLTAGSRMLALRRVGRDAEAFALAVRTLSAPASTADLAIAQGQYVQLRRYRPSHVTASHYTGSSGDLSFDESTVSVRHAPGFDGFGYALDVTRQNFSSDLLQTNMADERNTVAVGVFRENSRGRLSVTAGISAGQNDELFFGAGAWTLRDSSGNREVELSLAWQEPADESPELRLVGKRDRVGVEFRRTFANDFYASVGARASEWSGRQDNEQLATGVTTRAEFGLRRTAGSLEWSTSVAAEDVRNDRADELPAEFALSQGSTLDRILVDERTSVSLNASLSRGGMGSDFPDAASPRFFVIGGLGYAIPDNDFSLQLNAGAAIRVFGNDELGLTYSRDTRLDRPDITGDGGGVEINYRHHF